MSRHANEKLPGLPLFLCEQTNEVLRGIGRVCMSNLAKRYRSGVRYKSRQSASHMFRLIVCAIALIFCDFAAASCGGGISGKSDLGLIAIGQGDCDYVEDMIELYSKNSGQLQKFKFKADCQWMRSLKVGLYSPSRGFSCRMHGRSPLAGTRYLLKIERRKPNACGRHPRLSYYCVQGCTKNVPGKFDLEPIECDG
jgi:hypothetical protein